jgi:DSF synthase
MAFAGTDTSRQSWMNRIWHDAGRTPAPAPTPAPTPPAGPGSVVPFRGGEPADTIRAFEDDGGALDRDGAELFTRFEPDEGLLWCYQKHRGRPCFTVGLLEEIRDLQRDLQRRYGGDDADRCTAAAEMPLRYLVWASAVPGVFSLGGDLDLFAALIRGRDREGLRRYARACVDVCYLNAINLDLPLITVHLVQGDALGGGFESVLSSDVIVAEEGSQFGLPEVLFGLFPGMGAFSFLSRRLDAARAERMILSGKVYTAEELAELGVVDVLAPRGEGEVAVRAFVAENRRRHALRTALAAVRRRCSPVSYDELIDVVEIWVETALRLDEADLRRMDRLVAAQVRRRVRARSA